MQRERFGYRYGARVAKGRARRRLESALGVLVIVALVTAYSMISGWNPASGFQNWLKRVSAVSSPETDWKVRIGAKPDHAVIAGGAVVVIMREAVEARDAVTGTEIWSRDVPWAAVAGTGATAVVVVGRGRAGGYEVVDASTGTARWDDAEAAGVWTFREMVLALACPEQADCTLSGRAPADGQVLWRISLPGEARKLTGVNPALLGGQPLMSSTVDALAAAPGALPGLLGFPVADTIQVIETETGRRVREVAAADDTQVAVVGGRILQIGVRGGSGQCGYTMEARDPGTGQVVWRKDGYDLRTASGTACEQRRDPVGGGGALSAVRADGREVLFSAGDGRELWVGAPGERPLATDGSLALVRTADGAAIKAVDLGGGDTVWEQPVSGAARVALTEEAAVIVVDDRVWARHPGTGRTLAEARTIALVIGCGPDGLVLASGRTVGLLSYVSPGTAGDREPADPQ